MNDASWTHIDEDGVSTGEAKDIRVTPWRKDSDVIDEVITESMVRQNIESPQLDRHATWDLNDLASICRRANDSWWRDPVTGLQIERNTGELYALMHSELSEAFEGARKTSMDEHLPHRLAEEVELADLIIRVMDYVGERGFDIQGALEEKMTYNAQRADHKPENRIKPGGKK